MGEVTFNLGPIQLPVSWVSKFFTRPFRWLAGTAQLQLDVQDIKVHTRAITDIFIIILADVIDKWPADKRERILWTVANFKLVSKGLDASSRVEMGNPGTHLWNLSRAALGSSIVMLSKIKNQQSRALKLTALITNGGRAGR